jgi:hypothetical protein
MAYLIPARCGFKLTYMSVISSEVEGSRSLINGCSAGFLDYAFAPLGMTEMNL